jgi:hypothetical protein
MTTFTIVFPHRDGTPIFVKRHASIYIPICPPAFYRASLHSVLRLIRLSTNKPQLVPHPTGVALEVIVTKGDN